MNLKEIAENGARSLASQPKKDNGTAFAYGTIQSVSDGIATVYVNGGLLEGVPMVAGTEWARPATRCIVMTIGRLSTVTALIGPSREMRTLWSGSWDGSGSIEVPDADMYSLYIFRFNGRGASPIMVRTSGGGAAYGTSAFTNGESGSFTRYAYSITIDGDTMSDLESVYAYDDSAAVSSDVPLIEIVGVI